jgi:SAM-dependent methyltransferase
MVFSALSRSLARRGVSGTLRHAAEELRFRIARRREEAFDRRYGTDTGGTISPADLDAPAEARVHSARYQPTDVASFGRMLRRLRVRHREYCFVDLGSGKGRALMLAARYPFRRIVGVEVSPALHAIAERNLEQLALRSGRRHPFELYCADVCDFEAPDGPLVVYLYNPFDPPILSRVLDRLQRSLACSPRHVVIVYRNPKFGGVFEAAEFLSTVEINDVFAIYAHVPSP